MNPIAVSVKEGAAMIGLSTSALRDLIDRGLVPAVKFPGKHQHEQSRRVLIAVADLEKFVAEHRVVEPGR
jgi:hypothetical protein